MDGLHYLVLVDSYSKWPELIEMPTITATKTIEALKKVFTTHGLPDIIVSDNGRQFTALEMELFCRSNGIQQMWSPPYHPQSNGQAERFVDLFKRSMKKLEGEGSRQKKLSKFLFSYRAAPHPGLPKQMSPAEALMGRKLKTVNDLIKPMPKEVLLKDQKMESQFNRHHGAKPRRFKIGQLVWIKSYGTNHWHWLKATVTTELGKQLYRVIRDDKERPEVRHVNQMRSRFIRWKADGLNLFKLMDIDEGPARPKDPVVNQPEQQSTAEDGMAVRNPPVANPVRRRRVSPADQGPVAAPTDDGTQPLRRSTRTRKPPKRLQMDPTKKSYEYK